ncbi:cyclic pyranopterin monophosphate synthase MoaC [Sporomusa aerivorans]|uniref:cyclic pyranopterin monophosphate synthase MoaC n=1 Tax=Sporomusa aerivorans TaxID=204936 RepID=UPI00352AF845
MMEFTHFNDAGYARMVDVSAKTDTVRIAAAQAVVRMQPATLAAIRSGGIKKGDVLGVAQVAGIMGAKQTAGVIPMCHPLMLSSVNISFDINEPASSITINCEVKTTGKTGVEMEAISGAGIAAMTIYDMSKAIDRWMEITDIKLLEKSGGKSGHVKRGQ